MIFNFVIYTDTTAIFLFLLTVVNPKHQRWVIDEKHISFNIWNEATRKVIISAAVVVVAIPSPAPLLPPPPPLPPPLLKRAQHFFSLSSLIAFLPRFSLSLLQFTVLTQATILSDTLPHTTRKYDGYHRGRCLSLSLLSSLWRKLIFILVEFIIIIAHLQEKQVSK